MAASERSPTKEARPPNPMRGLRHVDVVLRAPVSSKDVPGLTVRVLTSLKQSPCLSIVCDVGTFVHPAAEALDALARLQLGARRVGAQVWLRNVSPELQQLLCLSGLDQVLRPWD